jgi:hypothetical protein
MVTKHSYGFVEHKSILRQFAEPLWRIAPAFSQKLQPHVLVVKVGPQLQQLCRKLALLLDVVERDVPRRVQRPVFVRQQLWGVLLQLSP